MKPGDCPVSPTESLGTDWLIDRCLKASLCRRRRAGEPGPAAIRVDLDGIWGAISQAAAPAG